MDDVTYTPDANVQPYQVQAEEIARRKALAQALMQQSQEGFGNRVQGNSVIPITWAEGLGKLGQAYFGGKAAKEASEKESELGIQNRKAYAEALRTGNVDNPMLSNPQSQEIAKYDFEKQRDQAKFDQEMRAKRTTIDLGNKTIIQDGYGNVIGQYNKGAAPQGATEHQRDFSFYSHLPPQQKADYEKLYKNDKIPAGYRQNAEGNLEAIPGGPADQKMQGQFNQDTAALNGSTASLDNLERSANEILNHSGLSGITGISSMLPNIPGSAAADAQAKLNTLKSQVAFGVLQDMRNNSKTGGALGAVSDAEGRKLESNLAALENSQSEAQMRESLKKIMDYAQQAKGRLNSAYNMKHGNAMPVQNATQLPNGWSVKVK